MSQSTESRFKARSAIMRRHGRLAILAAVAACGPAHSALAQSENWIAGSGNWSAPANWNIDAVPVNSFNVTVAPPSGGNINFDYSAQPVSLLSLTLDSSSSSTAATILSMSANDLSVGQNGESVGVQGTAEINQTGGTNTLEIINNLSLGVSPGSTGIYALGGVGTLSVMGPGSLENVGQSGAGIFNQSGGLNNSNGTLAVGSVNFQGAGTGSYSLSASGSLFVRAEEIIGDGGLGTFAQSGGTNTTAALYLGAAVPEFNSPSFIGTGTYTLSGTGSMSIGGSEFIGTAGPGTVNQSGGLNAAAGAEYVGFTVTGNYSQSGGSNTTGTLWLGYRGTATSTYTLSNGSVGVSGSEYVGNVATGIFNQNGGSNSASNLYVGAAADGTIFLAPTGTGTYILSSSGTLTVSGTEYVGAGSAAVFDQSAGTNTMGTLSLNALAGNSTATYVLSGTGSLSVSGNEYVEYDSSFSQTGGTNSAGGSIYVGNDLTNIFLARYNFSNGILNTNNLLVGSTNAQLGGGAIFNLEGTSASANINGTLTVYYNSQVLVSAGTLTANTLDLEGGYVDITGGTMNVLQTTFGGSLSPNAPFILGGKMNFLLGGTPDYLDNLHVSAAGTLDVQVGGYTQGLNYDWLDLAGIGSLGGTLEVDWVDGFLPSVGDQFTILTAAGGVTGGFNNFTTNNGQITYSVTYGTGNNLVEVTVTSVPEPASLTLVAFSSLLLVRRCRRGRSSA